MILLLLLIVMMIIAIHTINDESDYAYDMKRPKLGDAMFDENDMFENLFAAINVCPKLGDAMFNEDDIFSLPSFDEQNYHGDSMPPIYDDYIDESGFGRVSTLGISDPTIPNEKNFAYVESRKNSMLVDHEKNALCDGHCRCQNRWISGRGARTVRLRRMVTGGGGHTVYPSSGSLDGGNTLLPT